MLSCRDQDRPDAGQARPYPGSKRRVRVSAISAMPRTHWGDAMKFIIEVDFPLVSFNTYVRQGRRREKIGEVLGAIEPEMAK